MVQPVEAGPASLPEESGVQVRHLDDLCAVVSLGKSGDKREREWEGEGGASQRRCGLLAAINFGCPKKGKI